MRRVIHPCCLVILSVVIGVVPLASALNVRVNGDRVILRAAPSENSEIVTQVSQGDVLVAQKGLQGEWIEVLPPSRVSFWVYGELVKDGVVNASKVQVRVGPGISYRSVGEIGKGEKVTVRGEYREWLKIEAPPDARLWINRKYVSAVRDEDSVVSKPVAAPRTEVDDEKPAELKKPVARTAERSIPQRRPDVPADAVEKPEVVPVTPAVKPLAPVAEHVPNVSAGRINAAPEAMIKKKLVTSKEQGLLVKREGVIRRAGLFLWRQPSKYRLVAHDKNGVAVTVCYVLGDEEQVASMDGRTVSISGKEYWIQGVKYAAIVPEQIMPRD
jgi:hypothetical protein